MIELKTYRLAELSDADIDQLCIRPAELDGDVLQTVAEIETSVRDGGDAAVRKLNARYGTAVDNLLVPEAELSAAWVNASESFRAAVETAAQNIRAFHAPQGSDDYEVETMVGVRCWREKRAIERVGLYVPGGTAPLVSTLLMTAIPAQLAGCSRIVVATPPPAAEPILAVAGYLGLTEVVQVGGAQAIFALALGTETVPPVDKIFGPGNAYVTAAKWRASRFCAVDMIAGPSEVLVIADADANPEWVASDLLSQAEHGVDSQSVLVATDHPLIEAVERALAVQLSALPRRETAEAALTRSYAVLTASVASSVEFSNRYAPEHLILHLNDWEDPASQITNAGSVFCGPLTPESAGDYASGTNHTLPTAGFARSTSGLGVEAFQRTMTFQTIDRNGLEALAPAITTLARAEELEGHARAVTIRLNT
jgi:histidinol dehydrogenase